MHSGSFRIISLFGAALLSSAAWSYDLQNYYPLTAGNSWTYLDMGKDSGGTRWDVSTKDTQIVSQETVNGVTTWHKRYVNNLNDQSAEYDNLAWSDEGLMMHRMDGNLCTTPLTLLPRQLEMGASTPPATFSCGTGNTGTIVHTLLGIEDVSVEAGNFSACLKMGFVAQGTGWSSNETHWFCPNVGEVKQTWTDTENGVSRLNSNELRWANVNGVAYGSERTIGTIRTAYAYGQFFEDSALEIYNLKADGQNLSARFGFDPSRVFFAYQPQGNGTALSGLSFTNAHIKMNGTDLTIYNLEFAGTKYLTTWELQTSPALGFAFKSISAMPQ